MARDGGILENIKSSLRDFFASKDLAVVAFMIAIIAIIIVPLPSAFLDFFLTVSLALSVLIVLISIYVPKPVDLTAFPTLLLILTLYRLSLNIATTRMILSEGHQGPESVSDIITSFGEFVVGGNYVIGVIVFIILVLINFIVITKGSTRVAEVAARFTLDAMPGKQMAIDADLNSGFIDDKEAQIRRKAILQEASFYGAMDGSSKFVKGDAIAGIIITIINIIGGFLIGAFQYDMEIGESAKTFTILTIGDGLVSQIPALLIATATGIIITRASQDDDSNKNFAESAVSQLINDFKVLFIIGFILIMFALVPGLPTLSLSFVGGIFILMGYLIKSSQDGVSLLEMIGISKPPEIDDELSQAQTQSQDGSKPAQPRRQKSPEEIAEEENRAIDDILKVEILELDLGYQLIELADTRQGGDLLERIRGIRRKVATDYGFVVPQVRIRDNLQLPPNSYQILLKGVEIGGGEVYPDKFLAMNNGMVTEELEGIKTKEPAFGLDATWLNLNQKEDAIMAGYTVVDPTTVISTHISELVKKYAEELITRQDVQTLIDKVKRDYPIVVESLSSTNISIGIVQQVLKNLLHEKIPIKDMLTILETIVELAEKRVDSVDVITEYVRARLARVVTNIFKSEDGTLKILTFTAQSEQKLLDKFKKDQNGIERLLLNVEEADALIRATSSNIQNILQRGIAPAIVIVDPMVRKALSERFEQFGLEVVVLSHLEIDPTIQFEVLGSIEF